MSDIPSDDSVYTVDRGNGNVEGILRVGCRDSLGGNNFLGQEPGTDQQIKEFCLINYGVSFPMFSKISVRGKDIHPLYKFLVEKETNPEFFGKIPWNFTKFLVDRQGNVAARFEPSRVPDDPLVIAAIEKALQEK